MAKLVLSLDGEVLGHHFLDQARFSIGRRPNNSLQIDDSSVSKEHAVIQLIGNDHIIEDQGSTNSTLVNGAKVTRHILQHNDVIDIGRYQLRYINQKAQVGMDFDRTLMMMPVVNRRQGKSHADESEDEAMVSVARAANVVFPLGGVKGLLGTHSGQTVEINRPLATFGTAGVQLAVINRRPQGYTITSVEGKKPMVNGHAITNEQHPLADGDEIDVGGEKLKFYLNV